MATNNDNLLKQLIEAENSHDLERMLALMTDDVVIEDVPFGMIMRGKDGVKQGFSGFFTAAADFKVEPKSWVTNDRSFALEVIFTGTQKGDLPGLSATGKRFSIRGCSFGEFENGKIKGRRDDYWDSSSLTKQLVREQK
ncbi:MAG: ester cyclase [Thermoproteota archaeon]|nr:ester cyclase [Thermoproteota archaeon]